jgi:protein-arginine kinase activator protein McsA
VRNYDSLNKCSNCGKEVAQGEQYRLFSVDESKLQSEGIAFAKCQECGHIEQIATTKRSCFKCRKPYYEVNWYIPSGCHNCYRSFVD